MLFFFILNSFHIWIVQVCEMDLCRMGFQLWDFKFVRWVLLNLCRNGFQVYEIGFCRMGFQWFVSRKEFFTLLLVPSSNLVATKKYFHFLVFFNWVFIFLITLYLFFCYFMRRGYYFLIWLPLATQENFKVFWLQLTRKSPREKKEFLMRERETWLGDTRERERESVQLCAINNIQHHSKQLQKHYSKLLLENWKQL